MANLTVAMVVRFRLSNGHRKTEKAVYVGKTLAPPQNGGVFWLRWYEGTHKKWQRVGTDPEDALVSQMRQQRLLAQANARKLTGIASPGRETLSQAVAAFLLERGTQTDARGLARWKWELDLFKRVSGSTYLDEVGRADVFRYWQHYKTEGSAPRTIFNRIQTLLTFLNNRGIVGLLKPTEMPKYDEPVVDYYSDDELRLFFAACDSEGRLRYQFFLYTGCREREVMYMTWQDVDFDGRTVTVQAKKGFSTKNRRSRIVPVPVVLVEALRTYKTLYPDRPTIFRNKKEDGVEGHFLGKLKAIVKKAGLPGRWNLHKFRRTFATRHLEKGTPIQDLQDWIGHADLLTLRRYLANVNVKSERARAMADAIVI